MVGSRIMSGRWLRFPMETAGERHLIFRHSPGPALSHSVFVIFLLIIHESFHPFLLCCIVSRSDSGMKIIRLIYNQPILPL
jgi:hypothetical protein